MANKRDGLNNTSFQDITVSALDDSTITMIRTDNGNPAQRQQISPTSFTQNAPNATQNAQNNSNKQPLTRKKTLMANLKQNLDFVNVFKKSRKHVDNNTDKISQRDKEIMATKRNMKRTDTIAAILAVVSAIICYLENEEFYSSETNNPDGTIDPNVRSSTSNNVLRGIIIIFTVAICITVYLHYVWMLRLLKLKKLKLQNDTIKTSGLLWKLVLELLICIICTPPYFDYTFSGTALGGTYTYSWDAIVSVIMLAKSYLVLRLYGQYSKWTGDKAIRVCKRYKCKADVTFAIKAELKSRPYLMLGIFMIITIVYLGFALKTFERSYIPPGGGGFDFNYISNAFWVTIITMTTVGFGDGFPRTHLGRFIGVIACIIGMLLISLMVVSLTNASELTPEESKAFFTLKKTYLKDKAKGKAANIIKTLFKLHQVAKANTVRKTLEKFVWVIKLRRYASIYKNDYRVANSVNLPINEMLTNLQSKLDADITDIKKEISTVSELEARCSSLKERQLKLGNKMDEIIKLQGSLTEYLIKTHNMSSK